MHYFLRESICISVSAAINNAVDLCALRLVEHLHGLGESTQGIYYIMTDVFESMFSVPDITGCRGKRDWDFDTADISDNVSRSEGVLQNSSPLTDSYQPDDADIISLLQYLGSELSNSIYNMFSPAKHIFYRIKLFRNESLSSAPDQTVHELLLRLLKAIDRVRCWEPVETSGTAKKTVQSGKKY